MNIVLWLIAGAALGWLGYRMLRLNVQRGIVVAVAIGIAGAYFGGSVLAPRFANAVTAGEEFSPMALVLACAVAAACIYVSDFVYERFGV